MPAVQGLSSRTGKAVGEVAERSVSLPRAIVSRRAVESGQTRLGYIELRRLEVLRGPASSKPTQVASRCVSWRRQTAVVRFRAGTETSPADELLDM
jgi:hypothetical protein